MAEATNARFMRIAGLSRSAWKHKLFGFLPDEDLKALAEAPIEESIAAYNQAKIVVIAIYALIVVLLLSLSAPEITSTVWAHLGSLVTYLRQHLGC